MPKFLIAANYSAEGMKGVIAKGGVARREAVEKMVAEVGGTLESFNFAFGDTDAYVIVDLPDYVSAAAVAMSVGASGMASCKTTVLLSPEDVDRAAATGAIYRPPGS